MANTSIVKCYLLWDIWIAWTIFLWELSPFGPNLFMFGWKFIDSDNFKDQTSNVLKYPSDYLSPIFKNLHREKIAFQYPVSEFLDCKTIEKQ